MKKIFFSFLAVLVFLSINISYAKISTSGLFPVQPPVAKSFVKVTSNSIIAAWGTGTNDASCRYECENITNGTSLTPTMSIETWTSENLIPDTDYTFRVRAWDDNVTPPSITDWTYLGTVRTTKKLKVQGIDINNNENISAFPDISFSFKNIAQVDVSTIRFIINGVVANDGLSTNKGYDYIENVGGYVTIKYTPKFALTSSTNNITVEVKDVNGTIYTESVFGLQLKVSPNPELKLISTPLCYPNPFNPNSGLARISYYLSADGNIGLFILDASGKIILRQNLPSGVNGARYGYNEFIWDGKNSFGNIVDNDIYLICIANDRGNILGKTRIMVLK